VFCHCPWECEHVGSADDGSVSSSAARASPEGCPSGFARSPPWWSHLRPPQRPFAAGDTLAARPTHRWDVPVSETVRRVLVWLVPLPLEVSGTCLPKSKLGSCFPPKVRDPHGLPLLRQLRGATPFPDFTARMQPSDSPAASANAPVSPRRRPTTARTLLVNRPDVRSRTSGASEALGYGASGNPAITVDSQGSPRLLGRPLQACREQPPRLGKRRLAR